MSSRWSRSTSSPPCRQFANSSRLCGDHRMYLTMLCNLPTAPICRHTDAQPSSSPLRSVLAKVSRLLPFPFPKIIAWAQRFTIWPKHRTRNASRSFLGSPGCRTCKIANIAVSLEAASRLLFDFVTDRVNFDFIRKRRISRSIASDRYPQRLAGGHVTPQQRWRRDCLE